jgi:3-deoxy-D-manno-octulosonic-acid transferase
VEELLQNNGVAFVRRSTLSHPKDVIGGSRPKVILLDTMGELASVYALAHAVFVGGSLVPIGGHNVLEPAIAGKAVLFGPFMDSFKEARELLLSSGGGKEVKDAEELKIEVIKALEDQEEYLKKGSLARKVVLSRRGAARKNLGRKRKTK